MNLFDSSALLCFLQGEEGADAVERAMLAGGSVCAANWSEVAQKVTARDNDWELARGLLQSYPVQIEPVLMVDAEVAATLWRRGSGLSLGDRLCLATARRLDATTVWTTDAEWGTAAPVRQVRA